MNNTEIKKLLESSGVNIDYVTKNEIVTEGLLWSDFSHLVSFLKKNGVNEEEMCRYNPVSGYVTGPLSRYKLGIETTEAHRELHIRCELFCDLENQSESKESALTRILELLNQNGISMSVNRAEIRLVGE